MRLRLAISALGLAIIAVGWLMAIQAADRLPLAITVGLAITILLLVLMALLVRELERRRRGERELASQRDALALLNRQLADSEARLAERTALLDMVMDHTEQGIILIDARRRIRLVNRSTAALLELPIERLIPPFDLEFLAERVWQLHHLADPTLDRASFDARTNDLETAQSYERMRPDGTVYEVHSTPLPGGGAIRTTTDVTQRVVAERALRAAKEAAEEAMRARSAFLATMSHEIRTPLNGVTGLAMLLADTPLDETQRGYLAALRHSADHLLLLLNDVLDFSKLDAGRMDLEIAPFQLSETIENVIAILAQRASARGLALVSRIDDDVPPVLVGDSGRLSQILLNLGGNAVKFTRSGSVTIEVRVSQLLSDQLELEFAIVDTGIGIDPAAVPVLFKEFSQIDGSITRRYGGTGLGLAISNRLVGLMGGRMTVESEPGRGSRFGFTVLFDSDAATAAPPAPADARPPALVASPTGRRLRILVAEDNPTNQLVARTILEKQGCHVDIVDDGRQAVDAVQERSYDLVIMDVMMPEMSGLDATRLIRQLDPPRASVPIVAMTANAFAQDRDACLAAGMNGFIAKPATAGKLVAAINAALTDRPTPSAAPEAAGDAVLDEALLTLLEEDCGAALPDLLTIFLTESARRLGTIDRILAATEAGNLTREAHTLKGAAVTFGCPALGEAARRLEAAAASGGETATLNRQLRLAFQDARAALGRRYPGPAASGP